MVVNSISQLAMGTWGGGGVLVASAPLIFSVKNVCLFLYFMISLELFIYIY